MNENNIIYFIGANLHQMKEVMDKEDKEKFIEALLTFQVDVIIQLSVLGLL